MLFKLVNSSEFVVFSLAYESNLKELEKLDQDGFEKYNEWCKFRDYSKALVSKKSVKETNESFESLNGGYGQPVWTLSYRNRDYSIWLKNLLIDGFLKSGLIKDPILHKTIPFLETRISICEELLPYAFLKVLFDRGTDETSKVKLGRYLAQFFIRITDAEISFDVKKSIKMFIGVIEFLIENSIKRSKY